MAEDKPGIVKFLAQYLHEGEYDQFQCFDAMEIMMFTIFSPAKHGRMSLNKPFPSDSDEQCDYCSELQISSIWLTKWVMIVLVDVNNSLVNSALPRVSSEDS
jgi:hypothetical protein